jgi:hypothetical protein
MHKLLLNPQISHPTRYRLYQLSRVQHQVPVSSRVLVANADTCTSGKHAGCDVHGEKFLEEEFGGIGDLDLGDAGFVVAGATFVLAFLELAVISC